MELRYESRRHPEWRGQPGKADIPVRQAFQPDRLERLTYLYVRLSSLTVPNTRKELVHESGEIILLAAALVRRVRV
jgi:hypothetical protein